MVAPPRVAGDTPHRNQARIMKSYLVTYIGTLVVLVVIDAIWLTLVMRHLFAAHLQPLLADPLRYGAAAMFYLVFTAGLLVLVIEPAAASGSWLRSVLLGLTLGLTAYATYDLTNRATLAAWPMVIVVVDIAWGSFVSAVSALAGYILLRWMRGEAV